MPAGTSNRARASRGRSSARSASDDLGLALLERLDGRALEHAAVDVEARAVARAVPAALGAVPPHQAAEVRAAQRDGVQRAVLVAVDALLAGRAVALDARLAGRDAADHRRRPQAVGDEVEAELR